MRIAHLDVLHILRQFDDAVAERLGAAIGDWQPAASP